ncbi:MAG: thioesterase family protein [Parvibaculum sp.]
MKQVDVPPATSLYMRGDDGSWQADEWASGPFDGLQGGGVAGFIGAHIEREAAAEGWGFPASFTTHFLRPAPRGPLKVEVAPLRIGRRVSVVDATLVSEGRTIAVQRVTLINAIDAASLPEPRREPMPDPSHHPVLAPRRVGKQVWMWTAMDVREAPDGIVWFRLRYPLLPFSAPVASVLPAADWAHGIRPFFGSDERPPVGLPNPDVTAHFCRPPEGGWIGVRPGTRYERTGTAVGWGAVFDLQGMFGRVAMSIAMLPLRA